MLLRKKNILRLESEISSLLKSDKSKFRYPVKLIYKIYTHEELNGNPIEPPYKVLFIVPKRNLKKAFKRNLIKRRLREAFRINQGAITNNLRFKGRQVKLCFIYVSSDVLPFSQIELAVVNLINHIVSETPLQSESS